MANPQRQEEIQRAIEALQTNFKKDGADRKKSVEYFKTRIDKLTALWTEFQFNHDRIDKVEVQTHPYFADRVYDSARQSYLAFSSVLNDGYQQLTAATWEGARPEPGSLKSSMKQTEDPRGGQPVQDQEFMNAPEAPQQQQLGLQQPRASRGTSSKLDEMFRKQLANIKAFERTVRNIGIDALADKWELDDALKSLQSRWTAIDSLHWDIESENFQPNQEYETLFNEHEVTFNSMKKEINKKIWSVAHREKSTPMLEIPTFHGNYNTWVSFKDLFSEAIHKNSSLSNAQKMQFLKSKLKGEAERLIQHLNISSDNYIICWEILNNRFNNTKLIFTSHINILFNLTTMQQQSSAQIKKMFDTSNECLHAIRNLGIDISTWDPIIVHILSQKLDSETHMDYVESLTNARDLPILKEFLNFLESKFTSLEATRRKQESVGQKTFPQSSNSNIRKPFQHNNFRPNSNAYTNNGVNRGNGNATVAKALHVAGIKCPLCNNQHGIYNCKSFLQMPVEKRYNTIKRLALCTNCLFSHHGNACNSTKTCHKCAGQHNTLIHEAFAQSGTYPIQPSTSTPSANATISTETKPTPNISVKHQEEDSEILLATAQIKVKALDGSHQVLRALIDQGSQISLITEKAAQTLNLKRERCSGVIFGVGQKQNSTKGKLNITCASRYNDYTFQAEVIIMNNLVKHLPNKTFLKPSWSFIQNINLADPEFFVSRPIDLLLGADIYQHILLSGIIKGDDASQPLAQHTQIGWLLCGNARTYHCNVVINNLEDIKQFWEVEDIGEKNDLSCEDTECIKHYQQNTNRLDNGRYEVRLPMKPNFEEHLGESKTRAIAQLTNMERRLKKQEHLAQAYKTFMNEYLDLGHMKPCTRNSTLECYLPHHIVERVESTTSKYRVVFNGSAIMTSGHSLNDLMYTGPNLQHDLQVLLLKWRQYQFAFTADIEKMYRQILVNEADQQLQKIVWRDNPGAKLQSFALTTLTYGQRVAPFLALMTLRRLASDEREHFPEAANVLENSFYMDDLIHGSHSVDQGKRIIRDLNSLLKSGGFNLRKWSSNNKELLGEHKKEHESTSFNFKSDQVSKTLGLCWNPTNDTFTFKCNIEKQTEKPTKRTFLSEISKLYDPLGWIAPFIVKLKILFQKVWSENTQWDERISDAIHRQWLTAQVGIEQINECEIPRWLLCHEHDVIELHGFCDASNDAYACVVYARIQKQTKVVLVAAKTKLVPHKKTLTLPKLELSGAYLLTKLIRKIKQSLQQRNIVTFGYTDSRIVLGWIHGDPGRWKPFVANRVKQITEVMPANQWSYVKSSENPADAASRGLTAPQLKGHNLWWQGPFYLETFQAGPRNDIQPQYTTNEEAKRIYANNTVEIENKTNNLTCSTQSVQHINIVSNLLEKHSSIAKVTRIIAWILRALTPKRKMQHCAYLTLSELRKAKSTIITRVQNDEMGADIIHLRKHGRLESKSNLNKLKPFIDNQNILRVGGRLREANISYEMKHPKIIPKKSRLATLLIEQAHALTLHGGARLTMAKLREEYWMIGGNDYIKKQVGRCVRCKRVEGVKQHQLMGDLPAARVNEAKPFHHTGVDYTGFVELKTHKGRGAKTMKGYVAVFICMVTKAVHLELVTDLTSSAFLAALRRMAARRGAPRHIFSDNGRNFVGSNKIIQEQWKIIRNTFDESFLEEVASMEIEWHFNAPSWPSAGGLWERAVRSLKHHLKRVIGEQKLTFEEYATILAQVEACLNSRPLCPITEDIEDLDFLSPAHFLTSRAGVTIMETEEDARTRWHLTQKIVSDIWKRWKAEYLSQLTARPKWESPQKNIEEGDMVVIHDDNLPIGKWALGRVIDVHPGQDGYVRVVTLKTKNGTLKRPVVKLSVLPLNKTKQHEDSPKADTVPTSKNKQTTSNKKPGYLSAAITMFLYIMSLLSTGACVNITAVPGKQGLYFDKVGRMQLVRDEWKLIAYYNMNPYWEGITAYRKYNKQLESICKELTTITHCNIIMIQLQQTYDELQHYNQALLSQPTKRTRRGFINGVGNIANALFGVLDDKFAEQYQKDIELTRENEKHLVALWKNQTSIVEAEYNMLLRNKETIEKQHKMIHAHLINLEKGQSILQKELSTTECMSQFTIIAMAASNVLNHLRSIQDTLLDSITNIYQGKITIHLIDPQQLQREWNVISAQLVNDVTLPVDNIQTHLHNVYHLLKIKAKITDQYMIIEIRIPLISRDNYDLYNIIPVPHSSGINMLTVTPIETYVAMNLQKDSYMPIKENEIEHCVLRDPVTYMCHLRTPVYRLNSDTDLCLKDESDKRCKTNKAICQNKWTSLSNMNQYLYFCCDRCQIRTLCQSQVTTQTLTKTNIIYMEENCIVKTANFTIHTHKSMESKLDLNIDIQIPEIDPINRLINITLLDTENINNTKSTKDEKELSLLGDKIKTMKETEPLLNTYTTHDIHHYVSIYGLWSILSVLLIIYAWRRIRYNRSQQVSETAGNEAAGTETTSDSMSTVAAAAPDVSKCSDNDKCSVSARLKVKQCRNCSNNEIIELNHVERGTSPHFERIKFNT